MTSLEFLCGLASIVGIVGALHIFYVFRARKMRTLARRVGLQYIGPWAPKLWNPTHVERDPSLPNWVSRFAPSGLRIRQVWNVSKGRLNGTSVLIFDCIVGQYRGGHPCTLIALQTEQSPFGIVTPSIRVVQSHGWTVLHGTWFLRFSWLLTVKRIDIILRS